MDVNTTLAEIRELIAFNDDEAVAEQIVERVEALDEWLSNGGFLPTDWQR